jgi:hypothetical protein
MGKALKVLFWESILFGGVILINALAFYLLGKFTLISLPTFLNYIYFGIAGGVFVVVPMIGFGIKKLAGLFRKKKIKAKIKAKKEKKKIFDLEYEKYIYSKTSQIVQWILGVVILIFISINTEVITNRITFLGQITFILYLAVAGIFFLAIVLYIIMFAVHKKRIRKYYLEV